MSGEQKAFNEVRALLSKLDRSIDEARNKRVGPKDTPSENGTGNGQSPRTDMDRQIGTGRAEPAKVVPTADQVRRPEYGRARPLNRSSTPPPAPKPEPDNAWKSPKNYDDLTIG
ncbi:MAG: hypothetical protein AB8F26_06850 [Phycisphaerales bacterium]